MTLFWVSAAVLAYAFAGYPLLLLVLSSLFGKRVRIDERYLPDMTIIISAYNEQDVMRRKLENTLELDYPRERLEVIVASESSDETNSIAQEYSAKGVTLCRWEGRQGKSATLYRTVPLAKGGIIVFSDANAIYEKDALRKLARNFADPRVGCVSGRLKFEHEKGSPKGSGEALYWEFDHQLKKMASRLFSLGGCGGVSGSIFAIRKELYHPFDRFRGDDFEISCRIEISGHAVIMEEEAVSREAPVSSQRQEMKRKVRLAAWNVKSTLMLIKEALYAGRITTVLLLFSHRLLRYTAPVWLLLLLAGSACSAGIIRYTAFAQLIFYTAGAVGFVLESISGKASRLLSVPAYFFMITIAASWGLMRALGSERHLWEKAR